MAARPRPDERLRCSSQSGRAWPQIITNKLILSLPSPKRWFPCAHGQRLRRPFLSAVDLPPQLVQALGAHRLRVRSSCAKKLTRSSSSSQRSSCEIVICPPLPAPILHVVRDVPPIRLKSFCFRGSACARLLKLRAGPMQVCKKPGLARYTALASAHDWSGEFF